jgi:transcriptional regulator with XRE-family HTH domain
MSKPKQAKIKDDFTGKAIKSYRIARGMSQETLGESIGVTFQQVQKYEKGVNRVAVPNLMKIAAALKIDVLKLLPPATGTQATDRDDLMDFMATPDGIALARAFVKMPIGTRRSFIDLAEHYRPAA